jgi:hypothetical protein
MFDTPVPADIEGWLHPVTAEDGQIAFDDRPSIIVPIFAYNRSSVHCARNNKNQWPFVFFPWTRFRS